jgi:hypothetical protein
MEPPHGHLLTRDRREAHDVRVNARTTRLGSLQLGTLVKAAHAPTATTAARRSGSTTACPAIMGSGPVRASMAQCSPGRKC